MTSDRKGKIALVLAVLAFILILFQGCEVQPPDMRGEIYLSISDSTHSLDYDGGEISLSFTAYGGNWDSWCDGSWFRVSPSHGTASSKIEMKIQVDENQSSEPRTGAVRIRLGSFEETITVNQTENSNYVIYYTSTDGNIVTPFSKDLDIISNEYDKGVGRMAFSSPISSIPADAFYNCSTLESIRLPQGITLIDKFAFFGCSELEDINLPQSLLEIGQSAFCGTSLRHVTIPQGVMSIGSSPFSSCNMLSGFSGKYASADNKCLVVDGTLIAFAPYMCGNYQNIPQDVTKIAEGTFFCFTELWIMHLPRGIKEIGDNAFWGCSSLWNVYCEASDVPNIGIGVFTNIPSYCAIYVPRASVNAYKNARGWSEYADKIVGYDF